MKKLAYTFALLAFVAGPLAAQQPAGPFAARAFDAEWFSLRPGALKAHGAKRLSSQSYDYSYTDRGARYEVRYVMYRQTGASGDDDEYQASLQALTVVDAIAANETAKLSTSPFKSADVKKEFAADYGLTSFIDNGSSDFTVGYRYAIANFFYKKGRGIMCQIILFNDLAFPKTREFDASFHSFTFR